MKKFFELNIKFDVFQLIEYLDPLAYNLIDNGAEDYVLGWTYNSEDIRYFDQPKSFFNQFSQTKDYWFGYLGYDLRNDFLPDAYSNNEDFHEFPEAAFFKAAATIIKKHNTVLYYGSLQGYSELIDQLKLLNLNPKTNDKVLGIRLKARTKESDYLNNVKAIKTHIQNGNSYELNYCMQFFTTDITIEALEVYQKLRKKSKAPFSTLLRIQSIHVLSASPERFLKKEKQALLSQPIKGTAPRALDQKTDELYKNDLLNSEKEISENVMIVDLVRNDFSKIAEKRSVNVEALCALYSFPTVHQLISTVTCRIPEDLNLQSIFEATFPMGSMTGAPKISSTELIERFEDFKRGIYSGSVGYFGPNESFDFNVVIRSILYDSKQQNLSCSVGGAITIKSDPEAEYKECLLKLKLIQDTLA